MKRNKLLLLLILASMVLLSSCAAYRAPRGWLPEKKNVAQEVYGGWLYLEWTGNPKQEVTQGEFVGVNENTVFVFDHKILTRVPMDRVSYASLKLHDDDRSSFAAWTFFGTLSTITNGWFLVFSLPLWLFAGTAITSYESYSGSFIEKLPKDAWWGTVTRYSRFPQGIPKEVDLSTLQSKVFLSQ